MAVEKKELPQLEKLYQRGLENGVKDLKILDSKEIKEVEPYCEVRISWKKVFSAHQHHALIQNWSTKTVSKYLDNK